MSERYLSQCSLSLVALRVDDAIKRHRCVTSQALLTHTSRWKPQAEAGLWVMLKFGFSSGQKVWL